MNNVGWFMRGKSSGKKIFITVCICAIICITGIYYLENKKGMWVCENGNWISRGNTAEPKPETVCGADLKPAEYSEEIEKPQAEYVEADSKKVAEGIDIRIMEPHVNETVTSPVKIKGEAKDWFLDGILYVELVDSKGAVIAQTAVHPTGKDESGYEKFEAELVFDKKNVKGGDVVFKKDNPTGDPGEARTFSFHIFFE